MAACCFLAGCRTYFLGYPYPWNRPGERPQASDLVGTYKVLNVRLPTAASAGFNKDARITLQADGTAVLSGFRVFDDAGQKVVCGLSGTAVWKLDDRINSGGWSVALESYRPAAKPVAHACDPGDSVFEGLLVSSRHAPYRLYEIVGDPDSDTGIEFQRSGP